MAYFVRPGGTKWTGGRDSKGYREYKLTQLVEVNSLSGPASIMDAVGLPQFGDIWQVDNDLDIWAWCRWDRQITPVLTKEPNTQFEVSSTFSTKPLGKDNCPLTEQADPLLDPPKVSGTFVKFTKEATHDRFGNFLRNSANEQLRGKHVEYDEANLTVKIEMNVATLQLGTLGAMVETVNMFPLWGCPARCVKMMVPSWTKNFTGLCIPYYTWVLHFDIDLKTFDRRIIDEGTKVIHGQWNSTGGTWIRLKIDGALPDPTNPLHFDKFTDKNGNPCKVILDGNGNPSKVLLQNQDDTFNTGPNPEGYLNIQKHNESDLASLGIPLTL